ncbi:hypothetical protein PQC07_gp070 [Aeromonas phage D3]|uniref:Uncharacterized protein n=2 Tax=Ludhianavirus TaxID=3044751 RepID=A0A514TV78_9CAUD|nr:hypothetical protein PQC07_gp070 [Aeromonas phage D3]YP_010668953.1 hypothetical protein PQC08_gp070 [Aeromonas phage D6]QDJ96935.1 hypothetical protein D3_0205 [Aeromonas phage D3]QDJ97364.1 hypothetical protein D6_0205 [Aeromonas phage D6]QEP52241.1 hypothetical protein D9_0034 [Aeromonas phage D9]
MIDPSIYVSILVIIAAIVWLVIGVNISARVHWAFGTSHNTMRFGSRLKNNAIFIGNAVFWPWLGLFFLYAILEANFDR